jgi:hypothetical protein
MHPARPQQPGWGNRHAGLHAPADPAAGPPRAALAPTLVVLIFGINPTAAVVASQVVLSFDTPLALVLLVLLTRRGGLWGSESTGGSPTITASAAERPKPVPPPRSGDQREAARLKGLRLTAERKRPRARLQAGELTLAQALAQDEEAARGMRIVTVVRALPGIGAATAARLTTQAGIDAACRVGALTTRQTARLLAAVAAVDAEPSRVPELCHSPDLRR